MDFPPGTAGWERVVRDYLWRLDGSCRVREPTRNEEVAVLSKRYFYFLMVLFSSFCPSLDRNYPQNNLSPLSGEELSKASAVQKMQRWGQ